MATITVRIPEELDKILNEVAEFQDRTKSWVVKKALKTYLEDLKDRQDGLKALEEFEKSDGKTYTIEEVAARNGIDWDKL